MIPIRDNIPSRTFPWVNVAIVVACSVTFVVQLADADGRLVERFGMVPARVVDASAAVPVIEAVAIDTPFGPRYLERTRAMLPSAVPGWATLLTCTFLHGGWLHFLGNMWFLWIFGDNVEDRLGHGGYALFYLAAGVGASGVHLVSGPGSTVPTIGASGAIAGVMGAYLLLYPRARVLVLVPIVFVFQFFVFPAALFLGLWFLLQLFQGALSIGAVRAGGVAWWAHAGGFAFGLATVALLRATGRLGPEPAAEVLVGRRAGATARGGGRGPGT